METRFFVQFPGIRIPDLGHEHDLRRFAQAFRALPVAEPKRLQTEPESSDLYAALIGDRVAVVNHSPKPLTVTVRLDQPVPPGNQLVDVSTNRDVIDRMTPQRQSFVVSIDDWDLRTFVVK